MEKEFLPGRVVTGQEAVVLNTEIVLDWT